MMYALNLSADGRILSSTYPQYAPADAVLVDQLPDGDTYEYRYVEGEFIHDPLPPPVQSEKRSPYVTWVELETALKEGVNSV